MDERTKRVYLAALAGLLHDVGKFAQRAGVDKGKHAAIGARLLEDGELLTHLVPPAWQDDVGDVVAYHHGGDTHKPVVQAVRVADWLAASERDTGEQGKQGPAATPLIPITARVSLNGSPSNGEWGYPLGKAVEGEVLFPRQPPQVSQTDYDNLWKKRFLPRIQTFPGPVDSFERMTGLMALLADTTTYIPSATPWEKEPEERTIPDVPLYNHLHLTAAIAVCLMCLPPDDLETLHRTGWRVKQQSTVIARLLKVDFSGIQSFIYRISEPADERTYRHSAKRLRGRSLHLALLNRAVGDWLARHLGLPPTNILYASGGVVEMLIPPDTTTNEQLQEAMRELEEAMWKEFKGDLGAVWANVNMQPVDFADVGQRRLELEERLAREKSRKWHTRLGKADFFQAQETYHTCHVCGLTNTNRENEACSLCRLHAKVGGTLPYTTALLHTTGQPPDGVTITLPQPMRGCVTFSKPQDTDAALQWAGKEAQPVLVEGVNVFPKAPTAWPGGSAPGMWMTANAAPIVRQDDRWEVLDFEQIADLSRGTPLLGILRGDADRMGLAFSHGLHPPTFSRTIALSQTIARFFGPYLNQLATTLTSEWREDLGNESEFRKTLARRKITDQMIEELPSLFYVLYAGGDDLFVVGPWDQMVTFALRLNRAFREYTCENEELTLSAGLVLVKPHFPIHQFARLAGDAERAAKEAGRDRLHIFGKSLPWEQADCLIEMAQKWVEKIKAGEMPRGLIHDLGHEARQKEGMFTPTLYYTLARRLRGWKPEQRKEFATQIIYALPDLIVPVSYASLITRKE